MNTIPIALLAIGPSEGIQLTMAEPSAASLPRFPHTKIHAFIKSILTANNVPSESAETVTRCLVAADLRGIDTHGVNRIPSYMARIRSGVLEPTAVPTLNQITPVVSSIDGNNSFGFLGATLAIDTAIEAAQTYGIGMASVKHSNHFGMSAWIVQRAIEANMMSLVFTNSSPALPSTLR